MTQPVLHAIYAVNQVGFPILSLLIFLPLAAAVALWLTEELRLMNQLTFITVFVNFILSLFLFSKFQTGIPDMQFVEEAAWIPPLGIRYQIGVDGISLSLIVLTTFLLLLIILFSWKSVSHSVRTYLTCLLLIESALIGVFSALDLFLFFVFWEVMLLPMYFLIKIWGGANRDYAALKYVLYTLLGSVLMLVGFSILYLNYHDYAVQTGLSRVYSFSFLDFLQAPISPKKQFHIFLLLFFGFAFKVPLFPFHTWLPDAHVEAPTAGSVLLAGVLLKMGVYGFVRYSLPLLPDAVEQMASFMSLLSVIGIVYGGCLALAQDDMKKLIAYSSISHLGFVMLGIFSLNEAGLSGGLIQMINHGISTAGLFFVVGFLYERRHTRLIARYWGLAKQAPILAAFFFIISLSSMGMPFTNGFVGEFLILSGAFQAHWLYAAIAVTGVLLATAYLFWLYQRVMVEPKEAPEEKPLLDLDVREIAICVALTAIIFWTGLYPRPLLNIMSGSVNFLLGNTAPMTLVSE